ncbi:hypothetical protein G7Y89_g4218 [Cudoniella acicularis]|uniref:Heterokaryon incompatibility domain-containing protein n=1 Tax=Cudoniella acicularis TaxID=354080 RepID=A0A8H4RR64_9HELO|nr:hypothetical protein G7Y89_g4218 [Cudoniella acicularis]
MDRRLKCLTCESVATGVVRTLAEQEENLELKSELVWNFTVFRENKDCSISLDAVGSPPRFWLYPRCTTHKYNEGDSIVLCPEYHDYLELIPSSLLAPANEHFILIDSNWIDAERLLRWPEFCNKHHAGSCHTLPERQNVTWAKYIILIDVEDCCLVEVYRPETYVALSYVWGKIPGVLETTKGNFDKLRVQGSLTEECNLRCLPKTVKDAITFTKMMRQRYLWVDRLCIIQDDLDLIQEQLSWMSSIYANSYFTIIAADGSDANYGLRGVGADSSPRSYTPKLFRFSETCVMMSKPEPETQYNLTEWHRRGWTFQERVLSPRNIVFFRNRVFWECRKSVWSEELAGEPDGVVSGMSARKYDRYSYSHLQWPDIHQYAKLVSSYNNRLLSYQSDGLRAFSAVLDVLSQTFEGGFLHGLSELFFDYALLWRPNTPAIRRIDADHQGSAFPSWSWVGWQGNIVISCLKISHQLVLEEANSTRSLISIQPLVAWYKISSRTGKKELISNSYQYNENHQEDSSIIPPGWSRVQSFQREDNIRGDSPSRVVFRQKDIPGIEFVRPVPIQTKRVTAPLDNWTSELTFQSHRTFLFIGSILGIAHHRKAWSHIAMQMVPYCVSCTLVDSESRGVGMLYLNTSKETEVVTGEKCEIILISGGIAHLGENQQAKTWLEEWKILDEIKDLAVYEYYNVLCVERKGSFTYRKALGRIWREGWHRQHPEELSIFAIQTLV